MIIVELTDTGYDDYICKNGPHFNENLCKWAVNLMQTQDGLIKFMCKKEVDELLDRYDIELINDEGWDYVYVANMCKADFCGSSIEDEEHMAKYIKDVIDDYDGYDGYIFNRWRADIRGKDIEIDWFEMM